MILLGGDLKKMLNYSGGGIINETINKLPFELHIPGYNYCGPGTKLQERLQRGDKPINGLDAGCLEHDIAYSKFKDIKSRHEADKSLALKAIERFRAKDSSLGEKVAALGVIGTMKAKVKLGMGLGRNSTCPKLLNSCLKTVEKIKNLSNNMVTDIENYKSNKNNKVSRKKPPRKPIKKKNYDDDQFLIKKPKLIDTTTTTNTTSIDNDDCGGGGSVVQKRRKRKLDEDLDRNDNKRPKLQALKRPLHNDVDDDDNDDDDYDIKRIKQIKFNSNN